MVSNSFLCHFPSHYLLRMNSRINYLQSMTRMLISSSHWWLVLLNMGTWLSHFWRFHFVIKNICLIEPDKHRDASQANKKCCLRLPGLWIVFYSLRCAGTACSEGLAEVCAGLIPVALSSYVTDFHSSAHPPLKIPTTLKNDCLSAQILWIFCCNRVST